ncbi:hypothetical protein ENBRE01_2966 [Enteropsectra breve]|nr:hypothetical protein ENBRE01_2966 [Enteropsectra breve]
MQRVCIKTGEDCLYSGITHYFNPAVFLECFNEKNMQLPNLTHLVVIVSKKPTKDQDATYCAVLKLLPQIKQFSLFNQYESSTIVSCIENMSVFDNLVYSLVLNNKEMLSKLTRFEVVGFNILCPRTIALLKQYKFEKLGLLGAISKTDPLYAYSIFKEETQDTIAEMHREMALKGLKYDETVPFNEYNNLRNSVISLTGTTNIITDAVHYRLIENLKYAKACVYRYNENCKFNKEEEIILKRYNEFKKDSKNIRKIPIHLETMSIDSSTDYLKKFTPAQREINKELSRTIPLYKALEKTGRPVLNVSKLIILNNKDDERNAGLMKAIGASVAYNSTIEITLTKNENWSGITAFLENLESLKINGKNLVLNIQGTEYIKEEPYIFGRPLNDFNSVETKEEKYLIKCAMIAFISNIYNMLTFIFN